MGPEFGLGALSVNRFCELVGIPGHLGVTLVYPLVGAGFSNRSRSSGLPFPRSQNYRHGRRGHIQSYGNGQTTVLDHFRMEFGFFSHPNNTRLQQMVGSQFGCHNQTQHYRRADRRACGNVHRRSERELRAVVRRPIGASARLASPSLILALAHRAGHEGNRRPSV